LLEGGIKIIPEVTISRESIYAFIYSKEAAHLRLWLLLKKEKKARRAS